MEVENEAGTCLRSYVLFLMIARKMMNPSILISQKLAERFLTSRIDTVPSSVLALESRTPIMHGSDKNHGKKSRETNYPPGINIPRGRRPTT